MLVPRFSIRTTLGVVTIAAIVFVVAGMAIRGETWAWGITIAVITLAVTMLVHAAWFGIVWMFARMPAAQATTHPAIVVPSIVASQSVRQDQRLVTGTEAAD
jgi:hypothetical protein